MAIQSSFYEGTALDGRTFPSSKHIATKAHMALWKQRVSDDVWEQTDINEYQLINNSCVLNEVTLTSLYYKIEVRVADAPNELANNPTDIAIVAGLDTEIISLVNDKAKLDSIYADKVNIDIVAGDLALGVDSNIIKVADDIVEVGIVATAIASGSGLGGTQFLGAGSIKSVQYMSDSESTGAMTVPDGTNAFAIDSLNLANGASLIIPDTSTFKVL